MNKKLEVLHCIARIPGPPGQPVARWQSGYAADCNSVYAGSIPTLASISYFVQARVAELVDATDLKSVFRKEVRVRFSPRAPIKTIT